MSVYLPNGRLITVAHERIGRGDEGIVFRVEGTDDLCAKVYFNEPDQARHDRLTALLRAEPARWRGDHAEHVHVGWPREMLVNEAGLACGFLMPLVDGQPLTKLFEPAMRTTAVDEPTWRVVIVVAARIARLVTMLHDAGIVIGDLKPENLLLSRSGHVTLIDCDTVQFTDARTSRAYPCTRFTPEYCPPLPGNGTYRPDRGHDNFSLAILVCQLLMEGNHPFEGVPTGTSAADGAAPENIRLQNNRILFPERLVPVTGGIPTEVLPPEVADLARTCFGVGHRDQAARPSAQSWADALDRAGFQLMGCPNNERHLYHQSLRECAWCKVTSSGLPDPYPRPPIAKVVIPGPAALPRFPVRSGTWQPPQPPAPPTRRDPARPAAHRPPTARPQPAGQPQRTGGGGAAVAVFAVVIGILLLLYLLGVR
ncbi:protein kinase domain-containing protein [Actinocrispum wychmicini]|uniref:Protein kinase-like protein n=1 Tax=Actinocrispum wychmicini TaxID=1213861 RepID=A0A4V6NNL5_9PSEU|nr:hypothetical protein [Actinocrispum wychmicini]TCO48020.1 protein kinase-like protein [Actinocrispum wychmicini]